MFLGTGKWWWLLTILLVVAGLIITSQNFLFGVLTLIAGMVVYSVAPRRKGPTPEINLGNLQIVKQVKAAGANVTNSVGQPSKPATPAKPVRPVPPKPVMRPAPELKPRAKSEISGRDADEV
ncbi:MAG: hypothetical protein ACR2J8_15040 [Thermomicrobiales bacterium]